MSDEIREREVQRQQQAEAARKQAEQKRLGEAGAFRKVVTNLQQQKAAQNAEGTKQQGSEQQKQGHRSSRMLVRAGIANRDLSGKLIGEGDARNLVTRRDRAGQQAGEDAKRQAQQAGRIAQVTSRPSGEQRGNTPQQGRREAAGADAKKSKSGPQSRTDQLLAAHSGIATPHAISGVGTAQSAATGAAGAPDMKRVIDAIVKGVRQGMDVKGQDIIDVELKGDQLEGTMLRLTKHVQGISLQVHTSDPGIARLLGAGSTEQELGRALQQRGITLRNLEVLLKKS